MEFEADEYAAFVDSFKADGMRDFLIRYGTKRFGPPDAATVAALNAIDTTEQLEALSDHFDDASD